MGKLLKKYMREHGVTAETLAGTRFKEKPIRLTVCFCNESELTPEEKARMESARIHLDRRVSELLADLTDKGRTVPAEAVR